MAWCKWQPICTGCPMYEMRPSPERGCRIQWPVRSAYKHREFIKGLQNFPRFDSKLQCCKAIQSAFAKQSIEPPTRCAGAAWVRSDNGTARLRLQNGAGAGAHMPCMFLSFLCSSVYSLLSRNNTIQSNTTHKLLPPAGAAVR